MTEQIEAGMADIADHRPAYFHGVVLFGTWTIIPQMHGSEIDAADIGHLAVYYHDFAMQAAEEVGAHAHQLGLGIKYMHPDAGFDHLADVLVTQVHGAVAIDDDFHMGAIARGADQCSLQLLANLVFQNDEGLQQHLLAGVADTFEHARKELLAVDQQVCIIAFTPDGSHQKRTSTDSGAWSDRCDQGRR